MKKAVLLVMAVVCVMVSAVPVFAVYDPFSAKAQAYNKKAEVLLKEMQVFADKIAAFNKPAFEAQLTKKEREYYPMGFGDEGETTPPLSSIMWNRVYVKDKTLVFASAGKNKKFTASFFATTDPAYVFGKNIKVGASTKVLESYFGDTVNNMGVPQGKSITLYGPMLVGVGGTHPIFAIVCENGTIAKITADFRLGDEDVEVLSKKTKNFASNKIKQIGLNSFDDLQVWNTWSNYVNSHYD